MSWAAAPGRSSARQLAGGVCSPGLEGDGNASWEDLGRYTCWMQHLTGGIWVPPKPRGLIPAPGVAAGRVANALLHGGGINQGPIAFRRL